MNAFSRLRGAARFILKKADMPLLGLCLAASCFGLVLVASATAFKGADFQFRRVLIQGAGILIGVAAYFIFSNVDVEHFSEKWQFFLLFNIGFIALLLTPLGQDDGTGNRAWLYAPGMPTSIQPAEIVKLTFTILLARQMAWFRDNRRMKGPGSLLWPLGHTVLMAGWIFIVSGDAGSALVYAFIYAGMALAAGLAWYWFAGGITAGVLGVGALALLDKLPSYMSGRFLILFDHEYSARLAWQQTRSLMTIGSGGLFGQGLFQGLQTQSNPDGYGGNLPVRYTDNIFAVCGEELGLVGCLAVILLEFFIVYRCFQTARRASGSMGALLCVGFGSMIIFQTVENIGMTLFVMPVIGLTLPFFSYGGSSIVTLFAAMGMVSGVRSRTLPDWLRN